MNKKVSTRTKEINKKGLHFTRLYISILLDSEIDSGIIQSRKKT